MIDLAKLIRDVPDFPKPGILFKDITPLLSDPAALNETVDRLAAPFHDSKVELVTGIESRGFLFGAPVAQILGAGFVPIRKPARLPAETLSESYELEYGTNVVEIHTDAIRPGQRVLMIDDLLATGGSMSAACRLVRRLGGSVVGAAFVVELCFLHGREKLEDCEVHSLIRFGEE
jgi:adenine phosphoribosyltransferase